MNKVLCAGLLFAAAAFAGAAVDAAVASRWYRLTAFTLNALGLACAARFVAKRVPRDAPPDPVPVEETVEER